MMKVTRRGLFGIAAGAAASGKVIAAKANELVHSSRIKTAFDAAKASQLYTGVMDESDEVDYTGPSSLPMNEMNKVEYWKKQIDKLLNQEPKKDRDYSLSKRTMEIETLKSVSYQHKLKMIREKRKILDTEYEVDRYQRYIKNVFAGRKYYDNGV